jgi:glycerol transport system ATP-binding protein
MTLQLEQVVKQVGAETHLYETSLTLEPGSVNVLLGPTTAGKTSLMRIMAGLDAPSRGRVLVDGADVTGRSVRKRNVAMVYQQFINYPNFTVYDNVASPLRRAGLARDEIDRRVRDAAARLRIEPLLERLPSELSGGQQQRTALARALVKEAQLLLLDEPLVNLDYKLREELRVELRELFAKGTAIVVYATTEPLEALMLSGNVIVMAEGRVLQSGPTIRVHNNPASLRVGEVFSDPPMNMGPASVVNGAATVGADLKVPMDGHLAALPAGSYTFGVRAPYLSLKRTAPGQIAFQGSVDLAEVSGSETFVRVDHGGLSWIVQEEGVHSIGIGTRIEVFLDPSHIFAFDAAGRLVASPDGGGA